MTKSTFAGYIALGDSISIDAYPAADVARRYSGRASTERLGAASLFYRNDDRLWAEFRGRDLHTLVPSVRFDDLTEDGATTHGLSAQVSRVKKSTDLTLITITAGGNDLLGEIGMDGKSPVDEIAGRLQESVQRLLELRPNAVVLLGTVYDPTDGTNRLPGYGRALEREAEWLRDYNARVAKLAATDSRLRLADIHAHFLGHGLRVRERNRWYLQESIIEPNARGASEVRRVWLDVIGK